MNAALGFGPQITPEGITFRLWAPAAKRVDLMLDRPHPMQAQPDGWYEAAIASARAGTRYHYRIDGERVVPDPASHFQPDDVFGPSEVIDHTQYRWRANWHGRAWPEAAVLELHVGTFTPAGTFRGVIDKLDHVRETGLTAIELMPIADFAGRWNWGYDGVLLYAPDSAYGRPDDLKLLIDEAHLRGLMVLLDVVYNHFGPEGNDLGRYAPSFFTSAHTPWGSGIDYRVPQVRSFAIGNALHWLRRYRFDGLRLDAVHAIVEPGEPSFLHELSRAVGEFAVKSGRAIHLILENDDNRAAWLDPDRVAPSGKYRAQWNDDYHHAWHVLLTTRMRRTGILPGRSPRVSPTRARHRRIVQAVAVAKSRLVCRRLLSSTFCKITIRSVTVHSGIGCRRKRTAQRSRLRWRSPCWRQCRRSCSWARNGDRPRRSHSSATSMALWRRLCAVVAAPSSRRPTRSSVPNFRIPLRTKRFRPRCSTGMSAQPRRRARDWTSSAAC
jgi:hypothetical protein